MVIVNNVMSCAIDIQYVYRYCIVMLSSCFAFEKVFHCKYYNALCYKAPWEVCFVFRSLVVIGVVEHRGWCFPKGGGFCNTPG